MSAETLQVRVYDGRKPDTLIYLPGLHGDWTLIPGFRKALDGRVRFVEITYPRTLDWTLAEYAAGVEAGLKENGISEGWLLGESFGSQVLWEIVSRKTFQLRGLVLAGGFAGHPARWAARLAEKIAGKIPLSLVIRIMFGYAIVARYRYRRSPATIASLDEFIARRTELDRQAARHRLHLVAENNPLEIVRRVGVPVYALSGFLDPVVPWMLVRPGLRKHCRALRDYKVILRADHNVLSTAPQESARQILAWMGH